MGSYSEYCRKIHFFPRVRTTWGSVMDKSVDKVTQINLLNLKVLKSDRDEFQIS